MAFPLFQHYTQPPVSLREVWYITHVHLQSLEHIELNYTLI